MNDGERAEWTREAIERSRATPADDDLGYTEAEDLRVHTHLDPEIEYVVFVAQDNAQAYIRMDTRFVYDLETFASHEATDVQREFE